MPDSDWLKPVSAGVASKVALSPRQGRRGLVLLGCGECVMGGDGPDHQLIKRSAGDFCMPLAIT